MSRARYRSLPSSLLLLSRAFTVTQPMAKDKETAELESLKDTLGALPRDVIDEIAMARPADGYPFFTQLLFKFRCFADDTTHIIITDMVLRAIDSPSRQSGCRTYQNLSLGAKMSAQGSLDRKRKSENDRLWGVQD